MRRNGFCLALLIAGMTAALAAQNQTDWLVTRQRGGFRHVAGGSPGP